MGLSVGRTVSRIVRFMFNPDKRGRFFITWVPNRNLQNRIVKKNGVMYPGNEHIGSFGCDSYDISGTVGGVGSKRVLYTG